VWDADPGAGAGGAGHGAHQRIAVLNLRHSLSTGFVALRATGQLDWPAPVNVNRLLGRDLAGTFAWLRHPLFRALV